MTDYNSDFYLWAQQQAQLLRQSAWSQLDLENLIEEIASMGKRERRALGSYLRNVIMHLLKWQYQPQRRSTSWQASINSGRDELEVLLTDSPSLHPQLIDLIAEEYRRARKQAALETALPLSTFPAQCPFSNEQIISDWWPE